MRACVRVCYGETTRIRLCLLSSHINTSSDPESVARADPALMGFDGFLVDEATT